MSGLFQDVQQMVVVVGHEYELCLWKTFMMETSNILTDYKFHDSFYRQ